MDARTGGIGSVDDLHDEFAGPLYLYAWRRLGDAGAAEEVVQDTLLRAWRHGHRFDPARGPLAPWLFAIARNVVTDRLRRRGARPPEAAWGDDVDVPLTGDDVDRALEAWQLAEALHGLSADHRETIVAVHYLGFTVREVAADHGVPEGTVKSRLYYGLRALRLRLEEMGVVG